MPTHAARISTIALTSDRVSGSPTQSVASHTLTTGVASRRATSSRPAAPAGHRRRPVGDRRRHAHVEQQRGPAPPRSRSTRRRHSFHRQAPGGDERASARLHGSTSSGALRQGCLRILQNIAPIGAPRQDGEVLPATAARASILGYRGLRARAAPAGRLRRRARARTSAARRGRCSRLARPKRRGEASTTERPVGTSCGPRCEQANPTCSAARCPVPACSALAAAAPAGRD